MDEITTSPELSPFHRGEQAVQQRLGVREKIEASGRRFIRREMTEQHRAFFPLLPFLLVATVDGQGRPWASVLAGPPGFASSPDPRHLRITVRPLPGDPLNHALHEWAPIGLLGIQLETRRRNRLSGKVSKVDDDGFVVAVDQAFGNCPQYIQTRATTFVPDADIATPAPVVHRAGGLDDSARALIGRADTFFIASVFADDGDDPTQGADVSHRGGRPGFVRVDGDDTLTFPDYSGNLQFNTIGNLVLNPRAGLVFVDFETGTVLQLTGRTELIWEGAEVQAFTGAERLIRFRTDEMIRIEGALPLRFAFGDYSPSLEGTGTWQEATEALAVDREHEAWIAHEIFDVVRESAAISSFYLRRADGKALAPYRAGQFLPIRLSVPGEAQPLLRTYTLSDAPDTGHYRLSIKRETEGRVSRYLHDNARPGFRLDAMTPRGTFVCDEASDRPIVLISGGVGITPMIAIANQLISESRRTGTLHHIYFIHGTRNGKTLAFGRHLRALTRENPSFKLHIRFSQPGPDDHPSESHDSVGHVDIGLLKSILPFDDFDFFLCGPADFMQSLYAGLTGLGVRTERIHYESFGTATVLKPKGATPPSTASEAGPTIGPTIKVRFAHSNIDAAWSPEKGTLLELAEAVGLSPPFSCRSGLCGTCATRLICGNVDYVDEPVAPRADDEVLICSARPRSTSDGQDCGNDEGVILDL